MLCLRKSEENIKYTRLIEMINVLKLTKYKMSEAFFLAVGNWCITNIRREP